MIATFAKAVLWLAVLSFVCLVLVWWRDED